MIKKIIYLILIICFFAQSIAGTIDPSVADSKYIEYAQKFPFVIRICGNYDDTHFYSASAVAISDRIVLTAAHVVEKTKESFILVNEKKKIKITQIIIHKDFDSKGVGVADIAICFCEEDIGLDFYPKLYDNDDCFGKLCSICGYGMTGTFVEGANKSDDKKRAGSNIIDGMYKDTIVCTASRPSDKNRTELEFMIASGDSGGGLFVDGKLAGINSFVSASDGSPNSSYRDCSHYTSIHKHIDWIRKNIE